MRKKNVKGPSAWTTCACGRNRRYDGAERVREGYLPYLQRRPENLSLTTMQFGGTIRPKDGIFQSSRPSLSRFFQHQRTEFRRHLPWKDEPRLLRLAGARRTFTAPRRPLPICRCFLGKNFRCTACAKLSRLQSCPSDSRRNNALVRATAVSEYSASSIFISPSAKPFFPPAITVSHLVSRLEKRNGE